MFNGFELIARKRMADNWMMNSSFSYNSTKVNYGEFPGSQPSTAAAAITEDPTNREQRNGYQYDYLTAGSGIGNVYVNAKWLFKMSGMYQAPWGINVSAFYNARQGYPQEITVQTPTRLNGAGQVDVLLNPVGETRLPNFHNLDFHVERAVRFAGRELRAVAGRVQRGEREHDPGDSQPPERGERQPDPGDRRAARHPLRRPRELVSLQFPTPPPPTPKGQPWQLGVDGLDRFGVGRRRGRTRKRPAFFFRSLRSALSGKDTESRFAPCRAVN